jgi:hypothetical protein
MTNIVVLKAGDAHCWAKTHGIVGTLMRGGGIEATF